jgi:GTP-binding protein
LPLARAAHSGYPMNPNATFIDEATISVRAGDGGDGAAIMRSEKFVPLGGPDGGDGGNGADIVFIADRNLSTLYHLRGRHKIRATSGKKGDRSQRTGRSGKTEVVHVPIGTIVHRRGDEGEDEELLADLSEDGQQVIVARGGRGGRGNARFKTATRQAPDYAEHGRPGQFRHLRLSLKLLADIGFVGFPNAGKSTLLSRVSAAKPRVAAYPFTTLTPSLGVVEVGDRRFVAADIPGLIEGASEGIGLGDRFLRHIERTRVIVHLLDAGGFDVEPAGLIERYEAIRKELGAYRADMLERKELIVFSKMDLVQDDSELLAAEAELKSRGRTVVRISSATSEGVKTLMGAMLQALDEAILEEDAQAAEDSA